MEDMANEENDDVQLELVVEVGVELEAVVEVDVDVNVELVIGKVPSVPSVPSPPPPFPPLPLPSPPYASSALLEEGMGITPCLVFLVILAGGGPVRFRRETSLIWSSSCSWF